MPGPYARPFRFGISAEQVRTQASLLETARRGDEAGYATFLLRDHVIEESFRHQFAPFPALTAVATVTDRLRVGTLVCCNDYRHPVMLAKEAATLDALAEGRFELGLGAGFSQAEYERAGIPFDPPGRRVDWLNEEIKVIKGMWAGGPCTFAGEHYAITGPGSFPKPAQRPHIPIHLGGAGRRMRGIAARHADIVGIQTVSTTSGRVSTAPKHRLVDKVADQLGWLREAAGDRFPHLELSTTASIVVSRNRRQSAAQLARARTWHDVTADDVLDMPAVFIGSVDQIVETMTVRREQFGFSLLCHQRCRYGRRRTGGCAAGGKVTGVQQAPERSASISTTMKAAMVIITSDIRTPRRTGPWLDTQS